MTAEMTCLTSLRHARAGAGCSSTIFLTTMKGLAPPAAQGAEAQAHEAEISTTHPPVVMAEAAAGAAPTEMTVGTITMSPPLLAAHVEDVRPTVIT